MLRWSIVNARAHASSLPLLRLALAAGSVALVGLCLLLSASLVQATHGPDMTIAKTASVTSIPAGGSYSYTMTITNTGHSTATSVVLTDSTIEPDVEIDFGSLELSPSGIGSCTWKLFQGDPNNLMCSFPTIATGASITVTFDVTAPAVTCPRVRNTATVTAANEPSGNTGNNTAIVNVNMTGCPSATPTPTGSPTPQPSPPTVSRIFGADRYATAVELSKRLTPSPGTGVSSVYVATGENFPDALAGAPAAAKRNTSILLVRRTSVPTVTRTELLRLKPQTIFVLGGTSVISDAVAAELSMLTRDGAGTVTRLAGSDRYATAGQVVGNAFTSAEALIVATGENFPDALAGSAAASDEGMPILLVKRDNIPPATVAQLNNLDPARIFVLGGTSVVSQAVEDALRSFAPSVTRIAGDDRYLTAVGVTKAFYPPNVAHLFVATGINFPDALVAGPHGDPVLLTAPGALPSAVAGEASRLNPPSIHVLGGPGVVSETVLNQLRAT
ncbi:MAG TPA: cell wall-binding repeat-containing protein [candidate division Zixibacteria bacterium]|nr:cell wall-binding repeat-containing protein [candidate division Zixibacteria bacterium]